MDTTRLIDAYYEILAGGPAAYGDGAPLRPLLHDDLRFEGPIAGRVDGAARFLQGVAGFIATVRTITPLARLATDSAAAALYDAALPEATVRMAEFFEVVDGRITTLRLLYDPAAYVAAGGR